MTLMHSGRIIDEHREYLKLLKGIINKTIDGVEKDKNKTSYRLYNYAYSPYVLVNELIKKTKNLPYLKELKGEIVTIITIGSLNFEISLHLRRCIELTLKHIYYCDHPVEYLWDIESNTFDEITIKDLLQYLKQNPLLKICNKIGKPIDEIENAYKGLCKIVHGKVNVIPYKLRKSIIIEYTKEQIEERKKLCSHVMQNITILLIVYHKRKVQHFDGLIKDACLHSISNSSVRSIRSNIGI